MVFLEIARAIYDYSAQSSEELDVQDGDLLFVLERGDDGWWKCKKKAASDDEDEPEGLVPSNYIESAQPTHHAKALYDYTKQTDEELSFKEGASLDVYDESDPDWTLVGYGGEYGFAPAIYIEPAPPVTAAESPSLHDSAPPPMPSRPPAANDDSIPGEDDYPGHAAANPAAQLAGIIAQRTGGGERVLAPPPPAIQRNYTPEASDDDEPAPSLPQRPASQQTVPPSPTSRAQMPSSASPRDREYNRPGTMPSPPRNRAASTSHDDYNSESLQSPGSFHLYNVHEMVSHMGKNKKMPTTLGINLARGIIMISPEKSRDGPSKEWTAEKLTHYSIEGKHVFVELVRPSKSVDFHAGAKDTAKEIVAALGELAGAVRQEGLREVLAAANVGTAATGQKKGQMRFEFMAQGDDEVTVAEGDEVIVLDDAKSEEWWMVRRLKNGKEGVVPSSYVEITGVVRQETISGLNEARSTVEQNRREEERLTKEAARNNRDGDGGPISLPERHSSLAGDTRRTSMRGSDKRSSKDQSKSKPNQSRIRTWTDRSGTFKVDAEFIGLREGKIHLHKTNGVKIAVPVSKMAIEDLEYVERATGASLDDEKPLSEIKRRSTLKQQDKDRSNGSRSGGAGASVQKKADYDWFDFFLQCGVNPQICERYAGAFDRDQMGPEVLPDVNESLLRTLGLKEGDILRVMKFLDAKYDRKNAPNGQDEAEGSAGGLFSGPGGALRNNTRKGRPAPAVQTNDVVDEDAFKPRTEGALPSDAPAIAAASARKLTNGFDDDAWDIKPARTQTPTAGPSTPTPAATPDPPRPKVNDDIAQLSISAPPLQPTPAPLPQATTPAPPSHPPQQQPAPVANQAIFDKIASLAPAARQTQQMQSMPTGYQQQPMQTGFSQQPLQSQPTAVPRQRPAPPSQTNAGFNAPPPRTTSAPGFPSQQTGFTASPLQQQLTGYQNPNTMPQFPPQQQFQMQPQQTGFPQSQGYGQGFNQQNSLQTMQQNYPALQPQPTGFSMQPPMGQQYGVGPGYQMANGQQTGSPFADPPRQPFQSMPSGLSNSFAPQQTGFQPGFNLSQPTGFNGFGAQPTQPAPQLPPQQTGGVFGPSQPLGLQAPAAPLMPQKTGPAPPVRFGVQPGAKPLAPQPTGRANLSKATPHNPFGF
ncbi:cytoskeleton assembly control protein sla1 [Zymoseptoria brevis]|uniref:Actin cytoskeleton-regulatory complex protein SLA1 n=1 Tax=Zymoseptoria brevis TaxID=1047168 RepID=A0A0F4GX32_9PEZI|nr:cytoskeleton assembly control protein sla1 [Zymoseptoria brevis]